MTRIENNGPYKWAIGITDGVGWSGDLREKLDREKLFPLALLKAGLQVNLESAKASVDEDRVKILNTIAGRADAELKQPPCESHDGYEILNYTLAGRFAAAALHPLVDHGESEEEALCLCLERLKSSGMKSLDLSFQDCGRFDRAMAGRVFGSLPDSLENLNMHMGGLRDEHCEALGAAIKASTTLTTLDLRINDIGDDGAFAIAEVLKVNTSLTSISLTYNKFGYATREELLHAAKPTLQLRL